MFILGALPVLCPMRTPETISKDSTLYIFPRQRTRIWTFSDFQGCLAGLALIYLDSRSDFQGFDFMHFPETMKKNVDIFRFSIFSRLLDFFAYLLDYQNISLLKLFLEFQKNFTETKIRKKDGTRATTPPN